VSGNGIGFVSYGGDPEEEEVVEGALIHEVEAGFVAVDEGERGPIAEKDSDAAGPGDGAALFTRGSS
jgi:hypothetical protein